MLTELLSNANVFVATFSRPLKNCSWTKAVVSGERSAGLWKLRVETFTDRQAFTAPSQEPVENLDTALQHLLQESFRQILVQTPENDHHVVRSFKSDGVRVSVTHGSATRTQWNNVTADRSKQRLLTPEQDSTFLHIMDLATSDGRIKAPMADKFRQVNHMLDRAANSELNRHSRELNRHSRELNRHSRESGNPDQAPRFRGGDIQHRGGDIQHRGGDIQHREGDHEFIVLDAGCGKAYLSLSLVYVMERMGRKVRLVGIDSNPSVIEHCKHVAATMGFAHAEFHVGGISEVGKGLSLPHCDMLIALHACNTATDDALQLGLRLHAEVMLVAPCCHHEVQQQLQKERVPEWARPLLDDGITKERLGDLLTDTMRRDILRWKGYDAHLEEFISLEHTQKNILLKAVKLQQPQQSDRWHQSVTSMIEAWGVQCALWPRLQ